MLRRLLMILLDNGDQVHAVRRRSAVVAIARLTAEAHGGTVRLDATGPGGSRFVVTLPITSSAPAG
jgi:K+-sensing histidine kinase KdpD